MMTRRYSRYVLVSMLSLTAEACSKETTTSSVLDDSASDAASSPSDHVQQDQSGSGSGQDDQPASPVPTTSPGSAQTAAGDQAARDRMEKEDSFKEKLKDWWREMFDFVRSFWGEKPLKDQSREELNESLKAAADASRAGDPAAALAIRNIVAEITSRVDPDAKVVRISTNERGDIVITENFHKGTSGELEFDTKASGGGSTSVDLKAVKSEKELQVEASTGSKYTLDAKTSESRTYRQSRVGVRIITKEPDGSTAHTDIWYLTGAPASGDRGLWEGTGNFLDGSINAGISLREAGDRDRDREPICRCSHCRSVDKLPEGYYCQEMDPCHGTSCAKWGPKPRKNVAIDLWYYPGSERLVRRLPEYEAADRELEHGIFPKVHARLAWLNGAVTQLERDYAVVSQINQKSRSILARVDSWVNQAEVTAGSAQGLENLVRSHSLDACSAKQLLPVIQDARTFRDGVESVKPDFDRVVEVLVTAGEDRASLEVNWTNWTLPFKRINDRLDVIEKDISVNYCAKMQAAIDAIGARLDQERIRGINADLIAIVDELKTALRDSGRNMRFATLREKYVFEGVALAERLNKARLKREFTRATRIVTQARAWIGDLEAALQGADLTELQIQTVKADAAAIVNQRIAEWDGMIAASGQEAILNRRIFKMGRKLLKVNAALQQLPEAQRSALVAVWRDRVSAMGFQVPAQCYLPEHEFQGYCWKIERTDQTISPADYDQRLDGLDYLMDSYLLEMTASQN